MIVTRCQRSKGTPGYHEVTSWPNPCPHLSEGSWLGLVPCQQEIGIPSTSLRCSHSGFRFFFFGFMPWSKSKLKLQKLITLLQSVVQSVSQSWGMRCATADCEVEQSIPGHVARRTMENLMEEFCEGRLWTNTVKITFSVLKEGALELESKWSSTWGLCVEEWCARIWCLLLKCLYEQALCSDSLNRAKPILSRGLHCLGSSFLFVLRSLEGRLLSFCFTTMRVVIAY